MCLAVFKSPTSVTIGMQEELEQELELLILQRYMLVDTSQLLVLKMKVGMDHRGQR